MKFKQHITALLALAALALPACTKDDDGGLLPPNNEEQEQTPVETSKPSYTQRYNTGLKFYSKVLGQEIKYDVLLPKEYLGADKNEYAVIYLLHGYGCEPASWGQSGVGVQTIYDNLHSKGAVRPIIFVMPEGFNSYFVNRFDGGFRYMDMVIDELVPLIDKSFRTTAKASERGVAGFSMGGFGALSIASQHPETFSVCLGLSPSLNTDAQYTTLSAGGWDPQWGAVFGGKGTYGNSRLTPYYKSQCPLHFFADKPASIYSGVRYYIDCGDDEERLYVGNGELHLLMARRGVAHEYRVRNGAHTNSYWRESLKEGLEFAEASFAGIPYKQESPLDMSVSGQTASRNIDIQGESVSLTLPASYDASKNYGVLYVSCGSSAAGVQNSDIIEALDSLMQKRRMAVAIFNPAGMKRKGVAFADLAAAVESEINTDGTPASRVALVYGSDADYLFGMTGGNSAMIGALFAEDADPGKLPDSPAMQKYFLNVPDEGANCRAMFDWFCHLRNQKASVDYRVRNGIESRTSVRSGIKSFSVQLGQMFPLN